MSQTVLLRRSSISGNIPTTAQLSLGEIAINTYDGKMFFKKDNGTQSIIELVSTSDIQTLNNKIINAASYTNIHTFDSSSMLKLTNPTPNSLTNAALWLSGTSGSIIMDDNGGKRIYWNDGAGNFGIRSGNYYSSGEKYSKTGDGAAKIAIDTDGDNGKVYFRVANTGNAGDAVTWGNTLTLDNTTNGLTYNNNTIFHAGLAGFEMGYGLTADSAVFIDMHTSNGTGGVDYNARLIRNAGVDGILILQQTGTGNIYLNGGTDLVRNGNTIWHAGNDGTGSGLDADLLDGKQGTYYQPLIARNRLGYWNPPGNGTTAPGVFGMVAPTALGTETARNIGTSTIYTRLKRLGYVSSTTAGSFAGHYTTANQYTVSNTVGLGGFNYICRFGCTDANVITDARSFIGLSSSVATPTNVEPNTLTYCLGIAQLSTDPTQWYFVYGGSAAQTAIALGTNLGAPNNNTYAYELQLYSELNLNNVVYTVTNLVTRVVVSGTVSGGTTIVPAPTILLSHRAWRCNNTSTYATGIDISSVYIETPN